MIEKYRNILKEKVSDTRFYHSTCVEKQAVWLAGQWGADKEKAAIAGLLHDICKEVPFDEQLQYLLCHDILIGKQEKEHPNVWHGFTGATYLKYELGIKDEEILSAVWNHVVGKGNMNLLEEIIYLADITSEDRGFSDAEYFRELLPNHKNKAIKEVMVYSIHRMIKQKEIILPNLADGYNYYLCSI